MLQKQGKKGVQRIVSQGFIMLSSLVLIILNLNQKIYK